MAYLKEEIKAGIIIFVSLVVLSGFTILIGGSQLFKEFDVYYVKVMNAAGLDSGSQVKLGGVRVGRVLSIEAPDSAGEPVIITIGLKSGTAIYKGTKAVITQIGFVGDIYLLLAVNDAKDEKFRVEDTIPSVEGIDFGILMAKVGDISGSLDDLINNIEMLFSQSNIKNIEELVKEISIVLNEIGELVKDTKGEISSLITKAGEDLEKAGDMIKAMEETAKTVGRTSETVEGAVDLQSQNISNLIVTLQETTEDLQEVLQEIKNKPWSLIYKGRKSRNE